MNDKEYNSLKDLVTSGEKSNANIAYTHFSNYTPNQQLLFHARLISDLLSTIYRNPPYLYENLNVSHYPSTSYLLANGIKTWIGSSAVSNSGYASFKIYYEIARRYVPHLRNDMILCHYVNIEVTEPQRVVTSILNEHPPNINLNYIKESIADSALLYMEDLAYLRQRLKASRKNLIEVMQI